MSCNFQALRFQDIASSNSTMHYHLHFQRSAEQLIDIQLKTHLPAGPTIFHLPHWRPGRYELQNYARFVSDVEARDAFGNHIPLRKKASHSWEVELERDTDLILNYTFFANQTDAGGTYFDESYILFNGITCLMYLDQKEEESCSLSIDLPEGFQIGGDIDGSKDRHEFSTFHQLLDTPWLAGLRLQHHSFEVDQFPIHLWFLGETKPDLYRMEEDISQYSKAQLSFFGECPVNEYHYLYFLLPQRFRHGVEHQSSTVIVMGPGQKIMEDEMYKSLLEISSHEFFHVWNVKTLRPADMWPYRYEEENYSELHYITEGVTTYYGDLMLWKGGNWGLEQWINSINGELARHYQTGAQSYTSLTQASLDSWVNGYRNDGAPNRRISFYTKGYLVAMLLDTELRRQTNHKASLDSVMTELYYQMKGENRGYTKKDFLGIIKAQCGDCFRDFFERYIEGTANLLPALEEMALFYGFSCFELQPTSPALSLWGLRTSVNQQGFSVVEQLYPNSPFLAAGVSAGAELVAIENQRIQGNLDEWLNYYSAQNQWTLHYFQMGRLKEAIVTAERHAYKTPQLVSSPVRTEQQSINLAQWKGLVPPIRPDHPSLSSTTQTSV